MDDERLKRGTKALHDPKLRAELLATKKASQPFAAFCSKCRELGYEIYDMDLITAGEEAYAAMRRSTNGGGENSPMLEGAGKKLAEVLKTVTVQAPVTPYVTNVTAEYVTEEEAIKELLAKQVASSVLWQQSVERLIADGVDTFVEIGPGRSLSGFMRKLNREVTTCNIDKMEDFNKYVNR